jgi:flagellar M-ring protein FliF
MLSSQRTEDGSETALAAGVPGAASGVPGTASNLPRPPPKAGSSGSLSRRTENVTYQASRIVKHTRIPQGVIRRMSLSVLLDHSSKWEGEGAARRQVFVAPTPEVTKSIKELIAGATGVDAERGDQIIVEALPFESTVNAVAANKAPPAAGMPEQSGPPWLEFLKKNKELVAPVLVAALVVFSVLGWVIARMRRKKVHVNVASVPELEAPAGHAPPELGDGEPTLEQIFTGKPEELKPAPHTTETVRELARRDLTATANVVRMWLQESHT